MAPIIVTAIISMLFVFILILYVTDGEILNLLDNKKSDLYAPKISTPPAEKPKVESFTDSRVVALNKAFVVVALKNGTLIKEEIRETWEYIEHYGRETFVKIIPLTEIFDQHVNPRFYNNNLFKCDGQYFPYSNIERISMSAPEFLETKEVQFQNWRKIENS